MSLRSSLASMPMACLSIRRSTFAANCILRPNKFHSRESFFDFGKVFKEPAKENGVKYTTEGFIAQPVKIREVLFIDTDEFRLYNNAFILRRRIPYKDGFPIGEPEIVFKYRSRRLADRGRD